MLGEVSLYDLRLGCKTDAEGEPYVLKSGKLSKGEELLNAPQLAVVFRLQAGGGTEERTKLFVRQGGGELRVLARSAVHPTMAGLIPAGGASVGEFIGHGDIALQVSSSQYE